MNPGADGAGEFGCPAVDVPRAAASSPEAVVRFLVGELASACLLSAEQVEHVVGLLMRRESLGSTGIGGGIAIPHAGSDAVNEAAILVGRLPAPMDWQAIDGEPVRRVCLLIAPQAKLGDMLPHLERIVRAIREPRATTD